MIDPDKTSPTFNSYASIEDLKAYASARQLTLPNDNELPSLLIVAMDYLESQKWLGQRVEYITFMEIYYLYEFNKLILV